MTDSQRVTWTAFAMLAMYLKSMQLRTIYCLFLLRQISTIKAKIYISYHQPTSANPQPPQSCLAQANSPSPEQTSSSLAILPDLSSSFCDSLKQFARESQGVPIWSSGERRYLLYALVIDIIHQLQLFCLRCPDPLNALK